MKRYTWCDVLIEVEEVDFGTASYPRATLGGLPVPIAVLDGKPWFSTSHIQFALQGRFDPVACACFSSAHVGAHRFPFDPEDNASHVISAWAARALAETRMTCWSNRRLRGWLLQQDKRLRTGLPDSPGSLFVDAAAVRSFRTDGGLVAEEKHLWAERAASSLLEHT